MSKTILIASDIHGSMLALERVLELATIHRANKIILLGDIFGSNIKEMTERLNTVAYKLVVLKGNCDWYAQSDGAEFPMFEKTYENINGKIAYLCHGHRLGATPIDELGAKIVMFGHFHVPILRTEGGVIMLCPGSMAQPRSAVGKTFALIDDKQIKIFSDDGEELDAMNYQ